jgi:DNA-binding CsgD family transcriptional regulator
VTAAIDRRRVRAIVAELDTLRLDAASFAPTVLPAVRELIGLESVAIYAIGADRGRWSLTRFDQIGVSPTVEQLMVSLIARNHERAVFYDPRRVARPDRNRVIEARSWIASLGPETWERSPMCTEVMQPLCLHRHDQLRALVCDGPAMLAWFGGLHPQPVTVRQRRTLAALVPAMKRRLLMEARLESSALDQGALEAALELLGVPAFVTDGRGRIEQGNAAGLALLAKRDADVRIALQDAVKTRANAALHFELTRVSVSGVADHWLALLRVDSADARIARCARASVARWSLTPRQAQVLELVSRGLSNATIATMLGTCARTVEVHVSAILDRADVDSRAALVSRVLTGLE